MLWQDLHTFDGVAHPSFYAACLARGLLQNDNKWCQCLIEVSVMCIGDALHHLFAFGHEALRAITAANSLGRVQGKPL